MMRVICRVFNAGMKGQGLKAAEDITPGSLVIEYVGKTIDYTPLSAPLMM